MEQGHEHQERKGHGPQEEDDLLHQEPCREGRDKGTGIRLCGIQPTPPLLGTQGLWDWADLVSDPCSAPA